MKNIIICSLLICLCSCATPVVTQTEIPVFHPARPMPMNLIEPEFKLLVPKTRDTILVDNYSLMCTTWEDYLVMGQNMQEITRITKDYETLLCYYRKDLNELNCMPTKKPSE